MLVQWGVPMSIPRNRANQKDMLIIRMGIDTLLECVRQTQIWWQTCGESEALRNTEQLRTTILATRRKFFTDAGDAHAQVAHAREVAEGLREAAKHCKEGQSALQTRLIGAAEMIERLCQLRDEQS